MNSSMLSFQKGLLKNYFRGRKAIVASCFPLINSTQAIQKKWYNYLVWFNLIEEYFKFINTNFEVVHSPNGERCGSKTNNKSWNGVIGMIINQEADFGIDITNNVQRLEAVDFSKALFIKKMVILTKEPVPMTNSAFFLYVYTKEMYISVVLAVMTISTLTILFDIALSDGNKTKNIIGKVLWRCYKLIIVDGIASTMQSTKVLLLTWLLAYQVIVPVYLNFISAQFTVPIKKKPIDTGDDLLKAVKRGEMTWGTFSKFYYNLFETSTEGTIMHQLFHISRPTWNSNSVERYFEKVLNDDYAFFGGETYCKLKSLENRQYHVSSSGFCMVFDSLAMSKNSPHKTLVNYYMQYARDYGLMKKWEMNMELQIMKADIPEEENMILKLELMRYVFYILAIGLSLSGTVFVIEVLIGKCKRKSLENNESHLKQVFSQTTRVITEVAAAALSVSDIIPDQSMPHYITSNFDNAEEI